MEDEKKKNLYGGSYDDAIRDTYNQMQTRPAFSYDVDGDALYQQYKDRYTQNAKLAMKDTMGQAAALTGGYGNSYAQNVGQQRYDETMRGLTDMIPTLEERAYSRWKGQGDDLMSRYQMLMNMGAAEQQTKQDAYSKLYALIAATGYMPTAEELAAAGMSQDAADTLRNEYLRQTGQLPAAGNSGGSYYYWNGDGGNGGGDNGGGGYDEWGNQIGKPNANGAATEASPQENPFSQYANAISSKFGGLFGGSEGNNSGGALFNAYVDSVPQQILSNPSNAQATLQKFLDNPNSGNATPQQLQAIREAYAKAIYGK